MKTIFTLLIICLSFGLLYGQEELRTNIPATPTTAALGRFGEIPVSMHTGLANIEVPFVQLTSKDITIDIGLSYYSGGIKVEEMSSWVGLGWSLNAGGVITRQVRSLPDEDINGFLSKTIKNSAITLKVATIQNALEGTLDLEPDQFYFNFCGESGKFIYDEETEKFVTISETQKIIQYNNIKGGWEITLENGNKYCFYHQETNTSSSSKWPLSSSPAITTGWYLSKIINSNQSDSIVFEYQPYGYSFQTIQEAERVFRPDNTGDCQSLDFGYLTELIYYRNNTYSIQRIKRIISRSGNIEFIPSNSVREDLNGDYALDTIKVFSPEGERLYTFKLHMNYFSSGIHEHQKRLRLDKIVKVSNSESEAYREFEYSSDIFPSRFSFAQDYWGYYNGKVSNSNLVPTMVVQTTNGPMLLQGANREPSNYEAHSQIGMLKKIVYPTGGYTSLEYENHRVNESFFPPVTDRIIHLDASSGGGTVYSTSFTINYGPNILNGNNPSGGAFVSFFIDGITCEYGQTTGQASVGCAVISLSGPIGFTLTNNILNRYLPNGTYTFTFDFTTNPDSNTWAEFYGGIQWKEIDISEQGNSIVGGLRLKSIKSFDPILNKIGYQRHFKYHIEEDSLVSSAKFNAIPSFQRRVWYRQEKPCSPPCSAIIIMCRALKLGASSNYPITGLTDKITYSFVTVYNEIDGKEGKTTFEYSNEPDIFNTEYPFLPIDQNDWRRGKLLCQKEFSYAQNQYRLVNETKYIYRNRPNVSGWVNGIKIHPKFGDDEIVYVNTSQSLWLPTTFYTQGHYAVGGYDLSILYRSTLDTTISRVYDQNDPNKFVEQLTLNKWDTDHLNLKEKIVFSSEESKIVTHLKYPYDYVNEGNDDMSNSIKEFKDRNVLNQVIEESTWKKRSPTDSTLLSAKLNTFRIENQKIVLFKKLTLPTNVPFTYSTIQNNQFQYSPFYTSEIEIVQVDNIGNPVQAIDRTGIPITFIWDKSYSQPVAVANGSLRNELYYNGFEDDSGVYGNSKTGNKYFGGTSFVIPISNRPTGANLFMTFWYYDTSNTWKFQSEIRNPLVNPIYHLVFRLANLVAKQFDGQYAEKTHQGRDVSGCRIVAGKRAEQDSIL